MPPRAQTSSTWSQGLQRHGASAFGRCSVALLVQAVDQLPQAPEVAAIEIEAQARQVGDVAILTLSAGCGDALDRSAHDVAELTVQRRDLLIRDRAVQPQDQLAVDVSLRGIDAVERSEERRVGKECRCGCWLQDS